TGNGSIVVCDVGGGSTEIAIGGHPSGVIATASFDLGAFVLAERHSRHEPPTPSELAAAHADARQALTLEPQTTPALPLASGGPRTGHLRQQAAQEPAQTTHSPGRHPHPRRAAIRHRDATHHLQRRTPGRHPAPTRPTRPRRTRRRPNPTPNR